MLNVVLGNGLAIIGPQRTSWLTAGLGFGELASAMSPSLVFMHCVSMINEILSRLVVQ